MALDVDGATKGIREQIAKPLGLDLHHAASGTLRIVMSNMAEAIRGMTSETGDDPRTSACCVSAAVARCSALSSMDEAGLPAAIIPILLRPSRRGAC